MTFQAGDRIVYDEKFLAQLADPIQRVGTVLGIEDQRHTDLAHVRWDDFPDSTSFLPVTYIRKETP